MIGWNKMLVRKKILLVGNHRNQGTVCEKAKPTSVRTGNAMLWKLKYKGGVMGDGASEEVVQTSGAWGLSLRL